MKNLKFTFNWCSEVDVMSIELEDSGSWHQYAQLTIKSGATTVSHILHPEELQRFADDLTRFLKVQSLARARASENNDHIWTPTKIGRD